MLTEFNKYKKAGFACLPTGPDKMPAIPKGESWKGGWIGDREYLLSHGIALIAGSISGNLECIDFDNHFGDAKQVVQDFSKIDGVKEIISRLPVQTTVSGGYHILYRCSVIAGNQKLAMRPRTDETGKIKNDVLIETRGEGGYFVASPTPGYAVVKNDILTIAEITPDERELILNACRSFNKTVKVYNKPEEDRDKPGEKFNQSHEAVSEMKSALLDNGWKEIKEGIWQRPGKSKGISATLGIAAPGIFYNFSSAGDPFEPEKGYTAFQVVALLKYNGDFKAFAKELHERYGTGQIVNEPRKEQAKTTNQLDDILIKSMIDLEIPVARPPVVLKIRSRYRDGYSYTRVLTLGNFSAVKGKSKSKKTFLTSMFMAAAVSNGTFQTLIQANLPQNKSCVALFDTEQSQYDAYVTARRVWDLCGRSYANFGAFDLREYSPLDRCAIIERYLEKAGHTTGFIVIDGIADLANAINDEIEASRVVGLLMRWTKVYDVHILTVIHENKNDTYATGHLGSAILKKAECVISVVKDTEDSARSRVECDIIRGTMEFDGFNFNINDKGLPELEIGNSVQAETFNYYD